MTQVKKKKKFWPEIIEKGKPAKRELQYGGKGNWLNKIDKEYNTKMLLVHCGIHREILSEKSHFFVTSIINFIKCEKFFLKKKRLIRHMWGVGSINFRNTSLGRGLKKKYGNNWFKSIFSRNQKVYISAYTEHKGQKRVERKLFIKICV